MSKPIIEEELIIQQFLANKHNEKPHNLRKKVQNATDITENHIDTVRYSNNDLLSNSSNALFLDEKHWFENDEVFETDVLINDGKARYQDTPRPDSTFGAEYIQHQNSSLNVMNRNPMKHKHKKTPNIQTRNINEEVSDNSNIRCGFNEKNRILTDNTRTKHRHQEVPRSIQVTKPRHQDAPRSIKVLNNEEELPLEDFNDEDFNDDQDTTYVLRFNTEEQVCQGKTYSFDDNHVKKMSEEGEKEEEEEEEEWHVDFTNYNFQQARSHPILIQDPQSQTQSQTMNNVSIANDISLVTVPLFEHKLQIDFLNRQIKSKEELIDTLMTSLDEEEQEIQKYSAELESLKNKNKGIVSLANDLEYDIKQATDSLIDKDKEIASLRDVLESERHMKMIMNRRYEELKVASLTENEELKQRIEILKSKISKINQIRYSTCSDKEDYERIDKNVREKCSENSSLSTTDEHSIEENPGLNNSKSTSDNQYIACDDSRIPCCNTLPSSTEEIKNEKLGQSTSSSSHYLDNVDLEKLRSTSTTTTEDLDNEFENQITHEVNLQRDELVDNLMELLEENDMLKSEIVKIKEESENYIEELYNEKVNLKTEYAEAMDEVHLKDIEIKNLNTTIEKYRKPKQKKLSVGIKSLSYDIKTLLKKLDKNTNNKNVNTGISIDKKSPIKETGLAHSNGYADKDEHMDGYQYETSGSDCSQEEESILEQDSNMEVDTSSEDENSLKTYSENTTKIASDSNIPLPKRKRPLRLECSETPLENVLKSGDKTRNHTILFDNLNNHDVILNQTLDSDVQPEIIVNTTCLRNEPALQEATKHAVTNTVNNTDDEENAELHSPENLDSLTIINNLTTVVPQSNQAENYTLNNSESYIQQDSCPGGSSNGTTLQSTAQLVENVMLGKRGSLTGQDETDLIPQTETAETAPRLKYKLILEQEQNTVLKQKLSEALKLYDNTYEALEISKLYSEDLEEENRQLKDKNLTTDDENLIIYESADNNVDVVGDKFFNENHEYSKCQQSSYENMNSSQLLMRNEFENLPVVGGKTCLATFAEKYYGEYETSENNHQCVNINKYDESIEDGVSKAKEAKSERSFDCASSELLTEDRYEGQTSAIDQEELLTSSDTFIRDSYENKLTENSDHDESSQPIENLQKEQSSTHSNTILLRKSDETIYELEQKYFFYKTKDKVVESGEEYSSLDINETIEYYNKLAIVCFFIFLVYLTCIIPTASFINIVCIYSILLALSITTIQTYQILKSNIFVYKHKLNSVENRLKEIVTDSDTDRPTEFFELYSIIEKHEDVLAKQKTAVDVLTNQLQFERKRSSNEMIMIRKEGQKSKAIPTTEVSGNTRNIVIPNFQLSMNLLGIILTSAILIFLIVESTKSLFLGMLVMVLILFVSLFLIWKQNGRIDDNHLKREAMLITIFVSILILLIMPKVDETDSIALLFECFLCLCASITSYMTVLSYKNSVLLEEQLSDKVQENIVLKQDLHETKQLLNCNQKLLDLTNSTTKLDNVSIFARDDIDSIATLIERLDKERLDCNHAREEKRSVEADVIRSIDLLKKLSYHLHLNQDEIKSLKKENMEVKKELFEEQIKSIHLQNQSKKTVRSENLKGADKETRKQVLKSNYTPEKSDKRIKEETMGDEEKKTKLGNSQTIVVEVYHSPSSTETDFDSRDNSFDFVATDMKDSLEKLMDYKKFEQVPSSREETESESCMDTDEDLFMSGSSDRLSKLHDSHKSSTSMKNANSAVHNNSKYDNTTGNNNSQNGNTTGNDNSQYGNTTRNNSSNWTDSLKLHKMRIKKRSLDIAKRHHPIPEDKATSSQFPKDSGVRGLEMSTNINHDEYDGLLKDKSEFADITYQKMENINNVSSNENVTTILENVDQNLQEASVNDDIESNNFIAEEENKVLEKEFQDILSTVLNDQKTVNNGVSDLTDYYERDQQEKLMLSYQVDQLKEKISSINNNDCNGKQHEVELSERVSKNEDDQSCKRCEYLIKCYIDNIGELEYRLQNEKQKRMKMVDEYENELNILENVLIRKYKQMNDFMNQFELCVTDNEMARRFKSIKSSVKLAIKKK